jgi:hypothetical protein
MTHVGMAQNYYHLTPISLLLPEFLNETSVPTSKRKKKTQGNTNEDQLVKTLNGLSQGI